MIELEAIAGIHQRLARVCHLHLRFRREQLLIVYRIHTYAYHLRLTGFSIQPHLSHLCPFRLQPAWQTPTFSRPWEPRLATLHLFFRPMRPAGFRFLRHLASPLTTPLIRRSPPTQAPRLHSRAFQTSRRCWQQNDVVIVRRPWFTRRKVALVVVQGLCIYTCWGFIIRKLDSVLDDVELEPAEDGDEDSSLFIPLSFPKVLPQEYYKSTDPEWREFVKFSKDAKRKKGVRGKAVHFKTMGWCLAAAS